jgi:gluconolactonase
MADAGGPDSHPYHSGTDVCHLGVVNHFEGLIPDPVQNGRTHNAPPFTMMVRLGLDGSPESGNPGPYHVSNLASLPDLTVLHRAAGALLEAPRYDPRLGLIFSDARSGGVFALRSAFDTHTLIAHRRGIGGLAFHEAGGFVVTGRNVALKEPDVDGTPAPTLVLIDPNDCVYTAGFNDLTVDGEGRIYVGSLAAGAIEAAAKQASAPSGRLFFIDLDGSSRVVADDIRLPNGMALSPDGSALYVCDSGREVVFRFQVDRDTGNLSRQSVLVEVDAGVPDGMAVAQDGSIWLAHAYGGLVRRYTADGQIVETWPVPDVFVTSLSFGGPGSRQLYITTGATDASGFAAIYGAETDVGGVEVPVARVAPAGKDRAE